MATWRDAAKYVIQQALQEVEAQGLDVEATKKYVNSKYPFGARSHHPYKIWLSEMRAMFNPGKVAQSDQEKLNAWNDAMRGLR